MNNFSSFIIANTKQSCNFASNVKLMEYDIKDKIEWTVIFLTEFGKRHGLTLKQAFNYLLRYKGINFVEQHYDYLHTQSFVSAVDDLTQYCHKLGGGIA